MITRSIRERVEEKEAQACFLRDVQELTKRLALAGPNTSIARVISTVSERERRDQFSY
jgi:hypothetical protein